MKELWSPDGKKCWLSSPVLYKMLSLSPEQPQISAFLLCSFSYIVSRENTEEDRETPVSCRITDVDVIILSYKKCL